MATRDTERGEKPSAPVGLFSYDNPSPASQGHYYTSSYILTLSHMTITGTHWFFSQAISNTGGNPNDHTTPTFFTPDKLVSWRRCQILPKPQALVCFLWTTFSETCECLDGLTGWNISLDHPDKAGYLRAYFPANTFKGIYSLTPLSQRWCKVSFTFTYFLLSWCKILCPFLLLIFLSKLVLLDFNYKLEYFLVKLKNFSSFDSIFAPEIPKSSQATVSIIGLTWNFIHRLN